MSVLPPRLDALLATIRVVDRHQVVVRGFGVDCGDEEHRFAPWLEGIFRPVVSLGGAPARLTLSLRISVCTLCETVEVRDITVDRLDGLPMGRLAPRRRDALLGWYTGARRANRTYH